MRVSCCHQAGDELTSHTPMGTIVARHLIFAAWPAVGKMEMNVLPAGGQFPSFIRHDVMVAISRAMDGFVTRLQPSQLPDQAARQLPDLATSIRVDPSSTGNPRLQGALPTPAISILV